MRFYGYVKQYNETFRDILYTYNHFWTEVMGTYIDKLYPEIHKVYLANRVKETNQKQLYIQVAEISDRFHTLFISSFTGPYLGAPEMLYQEVRENLLGKLKRMVDLEISMERTLGELDLRDNIETGFRSGFYMHFRNLYNELNVDKQGWSAEEKTANFYFIREFCYGSMFRYNQKGHFNIPYGGIAYNKKNFKRKLDGLFLPETTEFFKNTELYNLDFEIFLDSVDLQERDLIFLDPPYDSDFSDYEGVSFNKEDQQRLANFLLNTKAQFILIIKATEYVFELYSQKPHIKVWDFDKQYAYNVRSRNNRSVKHLIVTNCLR